MTLTINAGHTLITVVSTVLDTFIAAPASFTECVITGYYNSNTTSTIETYSSTVPITNLTNVATASGTEYFKAEFFGSSSFADGIYYFVVTLKGEAEIQTDEGCIFVDKNVACQVDDYRVNEKIDFNKRLMAVSDYYLLKNSQSCACKCSNLIDIYNSLAKQLENKKCQTC